MPDRKRMAEQLLREGRMNQAILENVVEGIITIDANGVIQSFNSAAERMFGYSAAEAVGENVSLLMPEPERGQHDQYLRRYRETGEAKIIGIGRELVGRRKDGTTFPMHLGVGEVASDDQRVFVGSVLDLTESKRLEDELASARSLAAVGEMAASMAHQVKNPLAAISGVIDVLEESFVDEGPYHQVFRELSERVHRLDDTINRLLQFSKPLVAEPHSHDLYEILESLVLSLQGEEPFSAIGFQLGHGSHVRVPFDAVLFEQVLRNLFGQRGSSHARRRRDPLGAFRGCRFCLSENHRHRAWSSSRCVGKARPTLLHHQNHRNRVGSRDVQEDHVRTRWLYLLFQRARQRHRRNPAPSQANP